MNSETNTANVNTFVSRLVNAMAKEVLTAKQPTALSVAQNWQAAFAQRAASSNNAAR